MRFERGRLATGDPSARGEAVVELARVGCARIEHILTGAVATPVEYLADEDEWLVLLTGGATLAVDGELVALSPGDWLLVPAYVAHRLLDVVAGTSWVTVTGRVG
jgi:cupin 2 domain-containing protein